MKNARDVLAVSLVLLAACLACKGKSGGGGTGSATPASSAATPGGGRIRVTSITPDNEAEKKTLAATAALISQVLKSGSTSNVRVGAALAGFLDGLMKDLATKGYAVAASGGKPASFTGANPSEVALVNGPVDAYVVLEHVKDGTWVNVFPIRVYVP